MIILSDEVSYFSFLSSKVATQKLPTGEKLDGKKIYEQIIHYFTTTTLPIDEIYDKGVKVLKKFYPKVRESKQIVLQKL